MSIYDSIPPRPNCPAGAAWFHASCGHWVQNHEFIAEYHIGILVAYACPHCGGENPILMDEGQDRPDNSQEHEWQPRNRDQNQEARRKRMRMWS